MTGLDEFRASNPLTSIDTVLWTELEATQGHIPIEVGDDAHGLVLDTKSVREYVVPDLRAMYQHVMANLPEEDPERRPLRMVPYLLELIPYGVSSVALYEIVEKATSPDMDNKEATILALQAYSCCFGGWMAEDQRYERIKARPIATRELSHVDHVLITQRLAENDPDLSLEDAKLAIDPPTGDEQQPTDTTVHS